MADTGRSKGNQAKTKTRKTNKQTKKPKQNETKQNICAEASVAVYHMKYILECEYRWDNWLLKQTASREQKRVQNSLSVLSAVHSYQPNCSFRTRWRNRNCVQ